MSQMKRTGSRYPEHTVLVAEDDDGLRAALSLCLRERGYDVVEARDGREALARLQRVCGGGFGVIVLDLAMPVMDGWAFLQARRASPALASIPVIVLSDTSPADPRCRELPVTLQCAKPFRLEYLVALVDTLFESGAAPGPAPAGFS